MVRKQYCQSCKQTLQFDDCETQGHATVIRFALLNFRYEADIYGISCYLSKLDNISYFPLLFTERLHNTQPSCHMDKRLFYCD